MRLQGKLCECAIGVSDTVIHNNYVTLTSIFKKNWNTPTNKIAKQHKKSEIIVFTIYFDHGKYGKNWFNTVVIYIIFKQLTHTFSYYI